MMIPIPGTVEFAIRVAALAHENQTDRSGQPYIWHVLRVGMRGKTVEEQIVGILHDILEDTPYQYSELVRFFGVQVADAVKALTRTEAKYTDFILRVKENPLAKAVTLNDLADNLDPARAKGSNPNLRNRYIKAMQVLCSNEENRKIIEAWRPPVIPMGRRTVSSDNL